MLTVGTKDAERNVCLLDKLESKTSSSVLVRISRQLEVQARFAFCTSSVFSKLSIYTHIFWKIPRRMTTIWDDFVPSTLNWSRTRWNQFESLVYLHLPLVTCYSCSVSITLSHFLSRSRSFLLPLSLDCLLSLLLFLRLSLSLSLSLSSCLSIKLSTHPYVSLSPLLFFSSSLIFSHSLIFLFLLFSGLFLSQRVSEVFSTQFFRHVPSGVSDNETCKFACWTHSAHATCGEPPHRLREQKVS